ncbi:HEAT repeat domain-containing protein [Acidovorax sp.]|uniref:HEAT repeat domain-containing protein n=1 Tax=Acidovorax sp. TaxID=1872122 RepID=UPI0026252BE7|nr:HEAT repeat domain-containing protein [Acidovorax sp.]
MIFEKKDISALEGLIWQALQLYSIENLQQFVLDPDERVRFAAARHLQLHGGDFAYELALSLIGSADVSVRVVGIFILGQLGAPLLPYSEQSWPILVDLLREKSLKIRREAIVALGHLGVSSSIPHLLRFCDSKDEKTRVAVAIALSRFNASETAKSALKQLASDDSSEVRFWAA